MEEKKSWDLISVASIPLIMTLGNSMLIPVLPTIEKKLELSSLQVSMLITVYSVVAIILIPIAGFISDQYGRKIVIIPSLVIAGIGGLISGFAAWLMAEPYWIILAGRLVQGIGAAGAAPIVLPLVGDMFRNEKDVSNGLGIIETSNTFGKVLSPILGSILAMFIWFLPFFAFPLFCLISIVLVGFLVKTPKKNSNPVKLHQLLRDIKTVMHRKGHWLYAIFVIGIIIMFILFGLLFYLSSTLEDKYHIDGLKKGIILAIPLASLSLSSYITGKKIGKNKILMKWITFFGLLIMTSTIFISAFFQSIYILLSLLFLSGIGIGASLPSLDALITEGIEKKERGTITSIYSSMRFVGVALGPPIAAILMKLTHQIMFFILAFTSLIALFLVFKAIKPVKKANS